VYSGRVKRQFKVLTGKQPLRMLHVLLAMLQRGDHMPLLQLRLLGHFQLCYDGQPAQALNQPRLQSLLAFLALHCETPLTRQRLASLFWPQASAPVAHTQLDQLYQELIHDLPAAEHWLLLTPDTWQWRPDVQIHLDVAAFEWALAQVQAAANPTQLRLAWEEAANLYTGDLLLACQESWLVAPRERLRRQWLEGLRQLIGLMEGQGDYLAAVAYARRLWQQDPLVEAEVQRLVHLHVLHGERAGALQALQRRLEAAVRGRGGLVLLEGPAGIGKTSLALACQQHAHTLGAVFTVGHCYERGVLPPFLPWQELLATLEPTVTLDLRSLPEPFGRAPTAQSAHQLLRTITAWLRAASASQPLVLLLDDLHWADPDSLDLLDFVTRQVADASLLVIATYRSEEINRDRLLYDLLPSLQRNRPVEVIRLAPLSVDDTARLVEAYYGPCSPRLAGYLHARSEGHPLFLVELLNDLVDQKLLTQDTLGRWSPPAQPVPIPPLLQQVISGRVARLDEEAEAFLTVAAVAGERWDLAVVEAVLAWPEGTLLSVLDQVLAAHMVVVVDERRERYRFTHGLIREVLYHRLVGRRRKQLHARIAALLEARTPPDASLAPMARNEQIAQLAHHFYAAEQWDKALQYNRQAGDAAGPHYAAHSALQFYAQALDAAHRASMAVGADVLLALYERLGEVHTMLNHKEQAEVAFTHMLEAARSAGDSRAESRALCQLSIIQGWLNRLDQARSTGNLALHMAQQAGDAQVLALTHFNLGHLDVITGELAHARQRLEQAEQLAHTANAHSVLARSLQNQAYVATFTSHYVEAEQLGQAALEAAKLSSDALAVSGAYFVLGLAQVELGHYVQARRSLQAGVGHAEESGESHYLAKLLNTMGFFYNELGDGESALDWDKQALAACRRADIDRNWEAECYTLLNLASDNLLAGRIQAATTYRHEVEAILDRAQVSRFRFLNRYYLLCAELALAHGDPEAALHSAAEAASLAQVRGVTKNVAKSLSCEGQALLRLGRAHEATQRLEQAVTMADDIRHGSLRWKTRLRLAEAFARRGRPHAELLNQALDLVTRIAGGLDDEQLRATFLTSPLVVELKSNARPPVTFAVAPSPAPAPPSEFPAGLTAREVAVLRLVAQGATNRQIAETLFISVKTVNAHMTNILNKIGCDNRTAATTFAIQHGLLE
jgi:ATP/maltotriose-dependent transcriptional regulator MalT/DNA-binding SARP family transcriptional activator